MNILVTGATGYIGSHTCVELLEAGYEVIGVDNFSNSKPQVVDKIKQISGKDFTFYQADLLDGQAMERIFAAHPIDAVIHFAGYKAVGESVQHPLMYYNNNLISTIRLCELMQKHGVHKIVFSSSATVYGQPETLPIKEDFPLGTQSPYGTTKLVIENMLTELAFSDKALGVSLLRYFNPVGAHPSGLIGEDPNGIPNNLMPYISKVATGELKELSVFGNDYPTPDGTGVRDYIHVVDLAKGHIKALEKLMHTTGVAIYNLGTGRGCSVLEIVRAFEESTGQKIPYRIAPRRSGDVAECYADPSKAREELGWTAAYKLEDICKHTWGYLCNCKAE